MRRVRRGHYELIEVKVICIGVDPYYERKNSDSMVDWLLTVPKLGDLSASWDHEFPVCRRSGVSTVLQARQTLN